MSEAIRATTVRSNVALALLGTEAREVIEVVFDDQIKALVAKGLLTVVSEDDPTEPEPVVATAPAGNASESEWRDYADEALGLTFPDDVGRNEIRDAVTAHLSDD